MTDANGTYTESVLSDPFGLTASVSGGSPNPYIYNSASGYRSDGDGPTDAAPVMKVGARYYDPEFGCFLTRDTDLSQSPYVYCNGDPVNFTDPSGHIPRWLRATLWITGGVYVGAFGVFISVVSAPSVGGIVVGSLMEAAAAGLIMKGIHVARGGQ